MRRVEYYGEARDFGTERRVAYDDGAGAIGTVRRGE